MCEKSTMVVDKNKCEYKRKTVDLDTKNRELGKRVRVLTDEKNKLLEKCTCLSKATPLADFESKPGGKKSQKNKELYAEILK